MITIINATNLLGDSIYALQPIQQYLINDAAARELAKIIMQCTDTAARVKLVADKGLAFQMFYDTFPCTPIYDDIDRAIQSCREGQDIHIIPLSAGDSGKWCFETAQATGNQPHISEGYAHMLGIRLNGPILPYAPWNNWEPHATPPPTVIGISPFSRSCSRHTPNPDGTPGTPNKTIDDYKWMSIVQYLRMHSDALVIFGGPKDRLSNCPVSEDEHYAASSFEALRRKLKSLTCFITVDNGLGHLASVLGVPTILLWPRVSNIEFIAPVWAPTTQFITNIDPNTVTASMLLTGIRGMMRKIIDGGLHEQQT